MKNGKINPYIIIIVVLAIIVVGLAYNQWGKKFLPSGKESGEKQGKTPDVNIEDLGEDISIGSDDALVTIIEYFSYFCGYCKSFHDETYPRIVENYISKGKVKYIFRVYPPYELGMAVLCANDQDKFSDYHESLFENSADIKDIDDLKALAKDIGLDETEFNQCFDSEKYLTKAQAWYQKGDEDFSKAGVPAEERGTPAFFINNELLIGAQPYNTFVEIIEKKLAE